MFVIGCSITMAWLFTDEKTAYSDKILDCLNEKSAVVPSLWILEVINVLLMGEKRKRVSASQSSHFLDFLNHLPIKMIENQTKAP